MNRPLTCKEIRAIVRPVMVWREDRKSGKVESYEYRNVMHFNEIIEYGSSYRFWLSKPSEQERAAYEWES